MKIAWMGIGLLLLANGLMSADALSETCADYDVYPGIPVYYDFGSAYLHAIASSDNFAYVCQVDNMVGSSPELWCYELGPNNYDSPIFRSRTFLPATSGKTVLTDDHAVMSMGSEGLGVVNISDPDQLSTPVVTATDDYCMNLDLMDSGLLVTAEWSALKIYDMQFPIVPSEIGAISLSQARTVAVEDNLAFVACGNLGLAIVDVSSPTSPSLVTQFPVGGFIDRVAAEENRVYLTGYLVGLVTVDVTNPSTPQVIDTLGLDGEPEDIILRDGYAYVLADQAVPIAPGLPHFDAVALVKLNSTATPTLVGYFFPRPYYSSCALGDDRLFLGEYGTGRLVLAKLQCPDLSGVPFNPGLQISLSAPWPNPFNPRVSIQFNLAEGLPGRLNLHDLRGRLVAEIWQGVGTGRNENVVWNGTDRAGRNCPSGTYSFILSDQAGIHSTRVTGTLIR